MVLTDRGRLSLSASDLQGPRARERCGAPLPDLSQAWLGWVSGEDRRAGGFCHYPVVIKFAGDNSWSQGAGGIHGAAGVVDLQWEAGKGEKRGEAWAGSPVPLSRP